MYRQPRMSCSQGTSEAAAPILLEKDTMTTRTAQSVVYFSSPFQLPGFDTPQPAGSYRIDHDEELLEAGTRLAWRRIGTFIHLPAIGVPGTKQQIVSIDPAALKAARQQDHQQS